VPIFGRVSETGYWHDRIGMVMPGGRDTWWDIAAGKETAEVAGAVIDAIRDYGLPAMRARIADRR
jgi:hypothetical protein